MADVTLEGMDELIANLQRLGEKAEMIADEALLAGGNVIAEAMRHNIITNPSVSNKESGVTSTPELPSWSARFAEYAAKRYGIVTSPNPYKKGYVHLKDNIKVSGAVGVGTDRRRYVGPGKETAWRAKFVEFGTSKMPAEPFALPAMQENKAEVVDTMKGVLKAGMGI